MKKPLIYIKHLLKLLFKRADKDYSFTLMEKKINGDTWRIREEVLKWGNEAGSEEIQGGENEKTIFSEGMRLRKLCMEQFHNKYSGLTNMRVLIHVPAVEQSAAGYSLFSNLAEGLEYQGIHVKKYFNGERINDIIAGFNPSVFLTSDNDPYLTGIDWNSIRKYSETHTLKIGITASLEEFGNTPLILRLKRAKALGVAFFYSFRAEEHVKNMPAYLPFYDYAEDLYCIEFSANPIVHYPVAGNKRDIDYVFIGSGSSAKRERYAEYFSPILKKYPGFIDGPGWSGIKDFCFNRKRDRYIYSRGKAGLNLHINNQLKEAGELNERTYILAMCGIPQVVDNPPLLYSRFGSGSLFSASNPKEYYENFEYLINHEGEGELRALKALKEVFEKHTVFHRSEILINKLQKMLAA